MQKLEMENSGEDNDISELVKHMEMPSLTVLNSIQSKTITGPKSPPVNARISVKPGQRVTASSSPPDKPDQPITASSSTSVNDSGEGGQNENKSTDVKPGQNETKLIPVKTGQGEQTESEIKSTSPTEEAGGVKLLGTLKNGSQNETESKSLPADMGCADGGEISSQNKQN